MARSVDDIALALEAMAGHDPRDPSSAKAPLGNYCAELNDSIAGMRIGWPENWFFEFCDPQVRLATEEAAGVLAGMGASIKPMRIPVLDEIDPVWLAWQIVLPECASLHEINSSHFDRYAPEFVTTMLEGRMALAIDYVRALRMRALIQEGFEEAFKTIDVLMTPGALAAAPRIEREDSTVEGWAVIGDERYPWTVSMRSTSVFNLAGLPALTLPSGFSDEGLPIAVQLVALPYREAMCLKVAKAYQSATDHHLQRPPVLVDEELTSTAD
jgi:aspartyl-tRNA(Asn)/glutamyl-tRNA(Gln) amidotransferase subunit A